MTPAERFAGLASTLVDDPDVTHDVDSPKRAFGATSLKIRGRIFAMLVRDTLVVKLPAGRVEALADAEAGKRFDPGHGRLMREWLELAPGRDDDWEPLAREAARFVAEPPARAARARRTPG